MLPNNLNGDEQIRLALVCAMLQAGVPTAEMAGKIGELYPLIATQYVASRAYGEPGAPLIPLGHSDYDELTDEAKQRPNWRETASDPTELLDPPTQASS